MNIAMSHAWALFAREIKRFQKLWLDTVLNPVVTLIVYLIVLAVIAGNQQVGSTSFLPFVYAGLLIMTVVNSSFANPVFSLILSKNVGTIIDLQLAPLTPWKIGMAYTGAATVRALFTIILCMVCTIWFVPGLSLAHPLYILLGFVLTGLQFGLIGVTFGLWAKNFEALTFVTTFVLQPMVVLAGVFFPIANLPSPWNIVAQFNPLHHNINMFRFGITGYHDAAPALSMVVSIVITVLLFVLMGQVAKRKIIT